jgi:hypothetical protein
MWTLLIYRINICSSRLKDIYPAVETIALPFKGNLPTMKKGFFAKSFLFKSAL